MPDIPSKKTKSTKRNIPFLGYNVSEIQEFEILTNTVELRKHVFDHTVEAVTFGIKNNKITVDIFKIFGTNKIISLHKNDWKSSVQNAMNFYSLPHIEDYNKAITCRELISGL